jgi:hypothetical protein
VGLGSTTCLRLQTIDLLMSILTFIACSDANDFAVIPRDQGPMKRIGGTLSSKVICVREPPTSERGGD